MSDTLETGYHQITDTMRGYYAHPVGQKNLSAIIILQEIFGVNDVMQETCHIFAAQGYHAICPDLFHNLGENIQLSDKTEENWKQAFEYYQAFDGAEGIKDIRATINFARGFAEKVGAVGYCLGGTLAYVTATQTDIDASVGYYGIGIAEQLDAVKQLKKPLMLHIAEEDQFVSKEDQQKMRDYFEEIDLVTTHLYPGADHAFARIDGVTFHKEAAEKANHLTKEFFEKYL
ncbi:MAG: dienelactone hydrolase family protein [Pseudomonadota bacterium]